MQGPATSSEVLKLAGVTRAKAVVVAPNQDDTAVLITLSVREIAPSATIVASVRESDNAHLLRQSGADSVVVSSETAGRMLGLATVSPSVTGMMEDLISPDEGFSIAERLVGEDEVGGNPATSKTSSSAWCAPVSSTGWTRWRRRRWSPVTGCSTSAGAPTTPLITLPTTPPATPPAIPPTTLKGQHRSDPGQRTTHPAQPGCPGS